MTFRFGMQAKAGSADSPTRSVAEGNAQNKRKKPMRSVRNFSLLCVSCSAKLELIFNFAFLIVN